MRPPPSFATRARRGRKKLLLAIGRVEEDGPPVAYLLEEQGLHSQLTYLQGRGLWRSYMEELVRIEKDGEWEIYQRDLPKESEVAALDKKRRG